LVGEHQQQRIAAGGAEQEQPRRIPVAVAFEVEEIGRGGGADDPDSAGRAPRRVLGGVFLTQRHFVLREGVADEGGEQRHLELPRFAAGGDAIGLPGPVDIACGEFRRAALFRDGQVRAGAEARTAAQVPDPDGEPVRLAPADRALRDRIGARRHPMIGNLLVGRPDGDAVQRRRIDVVDSGFDFELQFLAFPRGVHDQFGGVFDFADAGPLPAEIDGAGGEFHFALDRFACPACKRNRQFAVRVEAVALPAVGHGQVAADAVAGKPLADQPAEPAHVLPRHAGAEGQPAGNDSGRRQHGFDIRPVRLRLLRRAFPVADVERGERLGVAERRRPQEQLVVEDAVFKQGAADAAGELEDVAVLGQQRRLVSERGQRGAAFELGLEVVPEIAFRGGFPGEERVRGVEFRCGRRRESRGGFWFEPQRKFLFERRIGGVPVDDQPLSRPGRGEHRLRGSGGGGGGGGGVVEDLFLSKLRFIKSSKAIRDS